MEHMTIADAQRDVRSTFLDGSVGQVVSGLVWLAAAMAASAGSTRWAILLVVVGGAFIFPLTQLALRLMGRPAALRRDHPMNALAMQIAFTVPLALPVAGAAALYRIEWFFPAVMVILGAHYLPFVFLYGMRSFAVLGGGLIGAGVLIALRAGDSFALGAWVTTFALLSFGLWAAVSRRAATRQAAARTTTLLLLGLLPPLLAACADSAEPDRPPIASPYSDLEGREIKALDSATIAGLVAGEGLGYALAAELNGLPGPRHTLDAAEALGLTADQRSRIQAIHDRMNAEAVRIGREIVEGERALDSLFASGSATPGTVAEWTGRLAALQGELRNTHLQAHLVTTPLLTPAQVSHYRTLRGYTGSEGAGGAAGHTGDHSGH